MCTYNGEKYLREQLESISAQTRLPFELVICDDASTDGSVAVVNSFAAVAPFPVRVYQNERNIGSTKNFEKAIAHCLGDIIALCDQDDVWRLDKLARIEEVFSTSSSVGLVFSDASVVDERLRPLTDSLWESVGFSERERKLVSKGKTIQVLAAHTLVTGATMAFRQSFRKLILPIPNDIIWIHDGWIAFLIGSVADVEAIEEPLVYYRQHSGQQGGIPARAPASQPRLSRGSVRSESALRRALAKQLEAGRLKLMANSSEFDCETALSHLEARVAHLKTRASICDRGLSRLHIVLRELFTFRYHRYSSGLYSAAKDLLL
jgi:glycosyltransferase involved in cell wall biosynthesis